MRVLVVLGTRPEVIKLATVIFALRQWAEVRICATGQHREMLSQALEIFDIFPDIALDVMRSGQSLNGLAARLLAELDAVLEDESPDWVVVQGDTTTAFCAGLAAFHRCIRVAHVEAGLRTGNLASPFPEEANRRLLARIATLHFAPTSRAKQALLQEGLAPETIVVTGNTVVDAIRWAQAHRLPQEGGGQIDALLPGYDDSPLILVTCHRRENFGGVLEGICQMLTRLCVRYSSYRWVFPVHLNPSVREPVHRLLSGIGNLTLVPPVDYLTTLALLERAVLVVSDSGGVQEEAPSFGVPVVVMRSHTERLEGVEAGFATLAGQSPEAIERAITDWLDQPERRAALKGRDNPYGDGKAADRVSATLFHEMAEAFRG